MYFGTLFLLLSQLLVVLHVNVHTSVQTHTEQVPPSTKSLWSPAHPTVPAEPVPGGPSQCTARAKHLCHSFTLGFCSLSSVSLFLSVVVPTLHTGHLTLRAYSVVLFSITVLLCCERERTLKIYFGVTSCFSIYVITLSHISATMWPL